MLTKGVEDDNIYELSREDPEGARKKSRNGERKKIEKNLKKLSKKY